MNGECTKMRSLHSWSDEVVRERKSPGQVYSIPECLITRWNVLIEPPCRDECGFWDCLNPEVLCKTINWLIGFVSLALWWLKTSNSLSFSLEQTRKWLQNDHCIEWLRKLSSRVKDYCLLGWTCCCWRKFGTLWLVVIYTKSLEYSKICAIINNK